MKVNYLLFVLVFFGVFCFTAISVSANDGVSKGIIMMWSGSIDSIPDGWHICDGTNNTVNLTNSFVVGANDTYAVNATGGSLTHTHTSGTLTVGGPSATVAVTSGLTSVASNAHVHTVSGTVAAGSSLPPYYALYYIQKVLDPVLFNTSLTMYENIVNATGTYTSVYSNTTGWNVWNNYTGTGGGGTSASAAMLTAGIACSLLVIPFMRRRKKNA